jgi:hypothetical protein
MDGRSELLAYLGSSLTTIAVLFGLQSWYVSYLDVEVVHARRTDAALDAKVAAAREQEKAKLSSGALPIEQAKRELAQRGRQGFPRIAPKQSDDLSAMSGWIHQPGFKGYEPRVAQAASVPEQLPAVAPGTEAAVAQQPVAPAKTVGGGP